MSEGDLAKRIAEILKLAAEVVAKADVWRSLMKKDLPDGWGIDVSVLRVHDGWFQDQRSLPRFQATPFLRVVPERRDETRKNE